MNHWAWRLLAGSIGSVALIGGCGGSARQSAPSSAGSGSSIPRDGQDAIRPGTAGAGTSRDGESAAGLGGSGNAGPGNSSAGHSPSLPVPEGGSAGANDCEGDFDKIAAIWDDCPKTLCAGLAWAENCNGLRPGAATRIETCAALTVITLDFATHGKACYYDRSALVGSIGVKEPKLVGAEAWDDVPNYCGQTSNSIKTGATSAQCSGSADESRILCDGSSNDSGGSAGAGGDNPLEPGPSACFNAFSSSCEPCCPAEPPDCASKPEGYPGYACTPTPNSYCSCQCSSNKTWSCGC